MDISKQLKKLATEIADIDLSNVNDHSAGTLYDGLHAVAAAIDDLTTELKHHRAADTD